MTDTNKKTKIQNEIVENELLNKKLIKNEIGLENNNENKNFIKNNLSGKEISLAPMLKMTTPYYRKLVRLLQPEIVVFSEMIVSNTVNNVPMEKLLSMVGEPDDKTIIQVAGSNPMDLANAVKKLQFLGHTEFNLNVGCPSHKVQKGMFGAILMLHEELLGKIVNTVFNETGAILSLKIRTGVDENDSYEFLNEFITYIATNTKCTKFYIHARKCWLKGLNPKQNRTIPTLSYDKVYKLKEDHPNLQFYLNGGVNSFDCIKNSDGVMIGRAAMNNLFIFNELTNFEFNLKEIIKEYFEYFKDEFPSKIYKILTPLMTIKKGKPNNKEFKVTVSNLIRDKNMTHLEVYEKLEPFL